LQLASGLGDRSAQLLRRVLLMDKHPDPTLARLLARSLALSGKPTEARRLVDRMAARRPLSRARTYLACGLFPAAIEELETFKKRHGNSPALEQLLLVAYLADGRDPQGRKLEERRK
jgi:predicted Zn-dependent protease